MKIIFNNKMKIIFNNKMNANITLLRGGGSILRTQPTPAQPGNKGNILGILKRNKVANIRADHIRSLAFLSPNLNNSKVVQGKEKKILL
jgi:hypothetical protein